MSKTFPFRAYRYNLANKKLAGAVCPPYDVISDSLEKKLKENPHNAIQIELPSGGQGEKYENAKRIWNGWKMENIVSQDLEPSLYIYEQLFSAGGKKFRRKGFFCEVQVEEPGVGSILRHELTISKPKEDRLNLIRALKMNSSPIFGLFRDPEKIIRAIIEKHSKQKPVAQVRDSDKILHRLWRCSDLCGIEKIHKLIGVSSIFIADGHHRYETAWNYSQELKKSAGIDNSHPANFALFFLCPMESPGLVVFPTHRVLKEKMDLSEILKRLESQENIFEVRPSKKISIDKKISFLVTDGKKYFRVGIKSLEALKKISGGHAEPYLRLPLVHLHSFLMPEKEKEDFIYTHDQKEAVHCAKTNGTVAFLVPPTSVGDLESVVVSGELMPQKSTYFYPKVITGLVFRSVEKNS